MKEDILRETIAAVAPVDASAAAAARARLDSLTKPPGSLGRLEEIAQQVAAITGNPRPVIRRKVVYTLAADHGVACEGVSAYPPAVTGQMVRNFLSGGAAINVLGRYAGAEVVFADFGVASDPGPHPGLLSRRVGAGTNSMRRGPAMPGSRPRPPWRRGSASSARPTSSRRGKWVSGIRRLPAP
jgi:nicotinate-nucleotide--dimethylbenzimidazole phosphoribosyltransferase